MSSRLLEVIDDEVETLINCHLIEIELALELTKCLICFLEHLFEPRQGGSFRLIK